MFLQSLDLTTALRPELLPDETLLFVQDTVGLYEGKHKIPDHQNGHVYLTSHRICYVDNQEPRKHSVAIELKKVERFEFYAGFLKSSAKITLYPKPVKRSPIQARDASNQYSPYHASPHLSRSVTASPLLSDSSYRERPSSSNNVRAPSVTWICSICSFSNPLPTNFDAAVASANTPLPPCLACGIKPPLAHLLKAVISSASSRPAPVPSYQTSPPAQLRNSEHRNEGLMTDHDDQPTAGISRTKKESSFQCHRCTFLNHLSLLSCELCGASLVSSDTPGASLPDGGVNRVESPGPTLDVTHGRMSETPDYVKLSFRGGGEKICHERLKGAMVQRKWLLHNAPPIPVPAHPYRDSTTPGAGWNLAAGPEYRPKAVGIAGLERRDMERRKNNEMVIGGAFEDLEALMTSAKEIIALAESFARNGDTESSDAQSMLHVSAAAAIEMVTTKDMLGSRSGSDSLYLSELSRNLAEYLTDDGKGILKKEGGIMSLVDLWAMFNRARNGVELISPSDFDKAARLWDKLGLPVRLRAFKNGLLVVQRHDWTDDQTIAQLLAWLQELHLTCPDGDAAWDWRCFGRGVTAQETASRFGWSVGVASEELAMAEEKGVLCREEGVEGLRFWENWIVQEGVTATDWLTDE